MIDKYLVFFREFFREFESTGSFIPTGRHASRVLTAPLSSSGHVPQECGRKVLEVGSGTGAITEILLQRVRPEDEVHLCEMNERLMSTLRRNLVRNPQYRLLQKQIVFHQCPIQELPSELKFDFIVCSLPFLNFPPGLSEEIFAKLQSITHPKSIVSFFEYLGIRLIRKSLPFGTLRGNILDTDRVFRNLFQRYGVRDQIVWLNAPPMLIHYLQFGNKD